MNKPLKRHISLQPVSREHHFGLLLCWKIRTGLKNDISPERIKKYVDWFYQNHLVPHFSFEENFVFPILGNKHTLIKKALEDHKIITEMVSQDNDLDLLLPRLERTIERHIRFEERILFNKIQDIATDEQLEEIESHHHEEAFQDNVDDVFWK
ncbi:hemerythrin domain-containing protein [Marinigracilibium pacificum]|uniref:Hemerythrin domain-containing protein n=1 Tax=Marinigracilibium pacificum TaxID=2729599 RepID=A0A848J6E8_9BACT|nr:hemerythrin domain-containing protein [Marinigracilibium pacificum]NMM50818.1 hemerythrin domain-containing protein [Marinigracilibium pacificum]